MKKLYLCRRKSFINQNINVMKKLFTLVVVMTLVVASFAQINQKRIYPLDEPVSCDARSEWVGWSNSQYYTVYDPDDIYITRLNSFGNLSAGDQITKVKFYWKATYNDDNNVEQNSDPDFTIKIYTGGNINWVSAVASVDDIDNAGRHTFEAADMGNEAYSQIYSCLEEGWQEVTLTTPYTVTGNEGEIWIGIHCHGTTTGLINCQATPGTEWGNALYRYETASNGTVLTIPLYYYDDERTLITTARYCLLAYVNDGQAFTPKSDWACEIYRPDDTEQYPDGVESFVIDQWTDSLYFYGGAFNMGPDISYGFYSIAIYLDGTTPYYFEEGAINEEADSVEVNRGWRWDFALCSREDIEDLGYSWPIQLCLNFEYESAEGYNGYDAITSNNTYCVSVDYDNGIDEKTNDLMVYPNPACNEIHIDNVAGAQVSIFNIAGQEVMSIENANASATINVANLTEGLYVVRVVNGNEVSTSKVNIVR